MARLAQMNKSEKEDFLNQTIGRLISSGIDAIDYMISDGIIIINSSFAELEYHKEDIRCILMGYDWQLLRIHKNGVKTALYSGIQIF